MQRRFRPSSNRRKRRCRPGERASMAAWNDPAERCSAGARGVGRGRRRRAAQLDASPPTASMEKNRVGPGEDHPPRYFSSVKPPRAAPARAGAAPPLPRRGALPCPPPSPATSHWAGSSRPASPPTVPTPLGPGGCSFERAARPLETARSVCVPTFAPARPVGRAARPRLASPREGPADSGQRHHHRCLCLLPNERAAQVGRRLSTP